MCEPVSIVMSAVAAVGSIVDGKNQQKAAVKQEEARRKQKIEMMRQSNYKDANLQLQDMGNYDEARELLAEANLDAIETQASVSTAIGESNLSGRSMERIERQVANEALAVKTDINRSYERSYYNIYAQREANRNELISAYEGMPSVPQPDQLGLIANTVGATAQGVVTGYQLGGMLGTTPKGKVGKTGNAGKVK